MYVVAVLDSATRQVLAGRLSNTITSDFSGEALEDALSCYGKPEIFNTNQNSQFTSHALLSVVKDHDIAFR